MDYNLRNIDPKMYKKARIKSLEQDLTLGEVLRRLLRAWLAGRIDIKDEKPTRERKSKRLP